MPSKYRKQKAQEDGISDYKDFRYGASESIREAHHFRGVVADLTALIGF